MKFLTDENIAQSVAEALRDIGHDVLTIHEWKVSATDVEVMRKAKEEGRIIITHDKDFANLFFKEKLKLGIILLRVGTLSPEKVKKRLREALEQLPEKKLAEKLVTISDEEIIVRK